ncbi:MAG: hypothetical protein AAFY76_00760 [Cyanobacteria bacterium J06649_11]
MAKRKNVQEQNELTKIGIKATASYWRLNELPKYLREVIESKGIDMTTSIVLEYEHNYPGTFSDFGLLLTVEKRFISFDVDYDDHVALVVSWEDVSHEYKISNNEKGFKKTYGYLACEVLEEMNSNNAYG